MSDHDDHRSSGDEFEPVLQRVADAFDRDLAPIPEHLTLAAQDAFVWRLDGAQLADVLFDSTSDQLVGVRGGSNGHRSFRFGAAGVVLRVHLAEATLMVMMEPPVSVTCRVATTDGTTDHRTDELGELVVAAPELPLRIEVDLPDLTVVSPWITG